MRSIIDEDSLLPRHNTGASPPLGKPDSVVWYSRVPDCFFDILLLKRVSLIRESRELLQSDEGNGRCYRDEDRVCFRRTGGQLKRSHLNASPESVYEIILAKFFCSWPLPSSSSSRQLFPDSPSISELFLCSRYLAELSQIPPHTKRLVPRPQECLDR